VAKNIEVSPLARGRERGSQIVELALVLPLLVFLALVVSEGVGIVHAHQVMTNAARESARMAVLGQNSTMLPPSTALQDAASCYMARNNIFPPTIPASCTGIGTRPASCNSGSYAVNISLVLIPTGSTNMKSRRVAITCGYRLRYFQMPLFNIAPVIPLSTAVEFRQLY
jgi:Flp pilus assembly protein TadG